MAGVEEFFKPPFLARMLERAGKYTDGLDDKDAFLEATFKWFEELSGAIKSSNDVMRYWDESLALAAKSRSKWLVHHGAALELTKWVRGTRLGRH